MGKLRTPGDLDNDGLVVLWKGKVGSGPVPSVDLDPGWWSLRGK